MPIGRTVLALLLAAMGLLPAGCCDGGCGGQAAASPGWTPVDVPLVFVSRAQTTGELPIEAEGRELRPGGTLKVREVDGTVRPLVHLPELFDVARPAVSPDGEWVVFSAVKNEHSPWSLFRVPAAGGPAVQMTFPAENPVGDLFAELADVPNQLRGVGDHAPIYLPDGRIAFLSTRYPTLAASCGQRSTNLYVMEPDGSGIRRVTSTRSGVVDPSILQDGRILVSYYRDNMNLPHPEGPGLRPIEGDRHWQTRYWMLWATHPDGTGAARYANVVGGVDGDGDWGVHHARELPTGDIVATVRSDATLIDRRAFDSAITVFSPGLQPTREVEGFGSLLGSGSGHAMSPAPLPDGRIVFSFGPLEVDTQGAERRPDFDLYLIDGDLDPASLVSLVVAAGTDELDAVPLVPWSAAVIADQVTHVPAEDPRIDEGLTATLVNHDVYADLPTSWMDRLSPRPASVAAIRIYDDSQQFHTDDNPQLNKQMPILLQEIPVEDDGSFRAEVPADRPIFFELVTHTGVAARHVYWPDEMAGDWRRDEAFVTVHDFLRPGTEVTCQGCHAGHMSLPEVAAAEARTNLARLATVHHDDEYGSTQEHFDFAPFRAIDQRLAESDNRHGWLPRNDPELRLRWPAPLELEEVVIYPLPAGDPAMRLDVATEAGVVASDLSLPAGTEPLHVTLPADPTRSLTIAVRGEGDIGLSEVEVHGVLPTGWPQISIPPPEDLLLDGDLRLSWQARNHPMLGGYQLLVRDDSGTVTEILDIGAAHGHTKLLYGYETGETVCLQLRPYDLLGRAAGPNSELACAQVPPLRVDAIEPASAPLGQVVDVTIKGTGFRYANDLLVSIGGFKLLDFQIVDGHTIVGQTRPDKPREAGLFDVSVSYVNGQRATLPEAFELGTETDH